MYIPRTDVEITKIVDHFKKAPSDDSFILDILYKTAKFKTIRLEGEEEDPISKLVSNLSNYHIRGEFLKFIYKSSTWQSMGTVESSDLITKNKDRIKTYFGSKSYTWAWFLAQLGSADESLKILNKVFKEDSRKVMNFKRAIYGKGRNPLRDIRYTYETLLLVTKDKEALKEKMRVIKTHISNLPQSHIKT
jgi:hypothetical protein